MDEKLKQRHRHSITIIYDVLNACNDNGLIVSHISRKANLSHELAKTIIKALLDNEYLEKLPNDFNAQNSFVYKTTAKGYEFKNIIEPLSKCVLTN